MESGETQTIASVRVGDRILAADAQGRTSFSPIVALPHKPNNLASTLSHITTEQGRDIKLSADHLILGGVCGTPLTLVEAGSIAPGACMMTVDGEEPVRSNEDTSSQAGLYTVVTQEDFIVVNGFIASPFSTNHVVASAFYNIHRMAFNVAPVLTQLQWMKGAVESFGEVVVSV